MTFEETRQFINQARFLANNAQKFYGVFKDSKGQIQYSTLSAPLVKGHLSFADAMKFEGMTLLGWASPQNYLTERKVTRAFGARRPQRSIESFAM